MYLALTVNKKELAKEGIIDFCPTRCMSGRPPTVTSSGKNKDYEKRWNNWTRPVRKATEEIKERNESLTVELKKVKGINEVNSIELKKLREHQTVYNSAIE